MLPNPLSSIALKWLRLLFLSVAVLGLSISGVLAIAPTAEAANPSELNITVYHDPSCHCCGRWIEHLQAQGLQVSDRLVDDIDAIKQKYNVPTDLTSCHTAVINQYVIEGHVPAADIKRLVTEKPNVAGLTAPGMPMGSPGMEMEGQQDAYTVFSFDRQGTPTPFSQYPASLKQEAQE